MSINTVDILARSKGDCQEFTGGELLTKANSDG